MLPSMGTPGYSQAEARLNALERRWKEANQRQRESITRFMLKRQAILDLLADPQWDHSPIAQDLIAQIRKILD